MEHRLHGGHDFDWDNNTGRGASLQEEIDFIDGIHQKTDSRTQFADGYGGASQGLSDYRQAIKAWVVVTSSQSVSFVRSNESFWRDCFPTFIFMELINVSM